MNEKFKIIVDPKFRNFWNYRGAYCFKPNRKELWDALCSKWTADVLYLNEICEDDVESMLSDYQRYFISRKFKFPQNVLVTEGEDGMTLLDILNNRWEKLQTESQTVFDVTGAGDTVTAILSYCTVKGMGISGSAKYAVRGAGISIQQIGCGVVTSEELFA